MKLNIKSLNYATILTIFLIVVFTIWGELSKSFKTFLVNLTGHHWVTKGISSLVFFIIIYFLVLRFVKDRPDSISQVTYTVIVVILAGVIIFGFYLWHLFL